MINRPALLSYFLLEADECVNSLIEGLENLETKGYSGETLESLFRTTHTLKGSASIVKFNKTTTLSHKLEDFFEALLNRELNYEKSFIPVIKKVVNAIVALVNEIHEFGEEKSDIDSELIELIDNILHEKHLVIKEFDVSPIEVIPVTNTVRVELRMIEDIVASLGELLVQRNMITEKEKELLDVLEEISSSNRRLLKETMDFSDRYWLGVYEKAQKVTDSFFAEFSDLEFDRYDEYHIFLRKTQEITNDIVESINSLYNFSENLSQTFKSLTREINYLKDCLIELRMLPIGNLLRRVSNAIKETAKNIGKNIEIEIKGAEIKVDKPVFDGLYEPILHILRNAIQHGIESPEERLKKGKKESGNITINVKKEGRYILINIKDDGRGIDIDKVKKVALSKGLITAQHADSISKEETLSYIFVPGFSTSEEVDFQSGRGLGLSIVKTGVLKLKGTLEVSTEIEKETSLTIKIPQSLSVSNLLVFRSSNLEFALPANYVEEILMLEDFSEAMKDRNISHRNRQIPVKLFSEVFFSRNGKRFEKGYIIVFNFSGLRKGLVVEGIIGHEEATIYSFGKFLEGLTHYLGYYISGSGTPRYVIDPMKIFEEEFVFLTPLEKILQEPLISLASVLVVDDSISVRKSLQSILEAKKIKVYTAKDAAEALSLIEEKSLDLVITDLEMPIMHGYELISRLRKDERFKILPIVVLTSRGTKKHEEKAFALGADGYLVKPFDEKVVSELLEKFNIIKS